MVVFVDMGFVSMLILWNVVFRFIGKGIRFVLVLISKILILFCLLNIFLNVFIEKIDVWFIF